MKLQLTLASALLALIAFAKAERTLTDYERLDFYLFNGPYNPKVLPAQNKTDKVTVKFGLAAIGLDMQPDGRLKALMWARMVFTDPRLAFDSKDFGGLDVIRVDPTRLWMPDITLYNSQDPRIFLPTRPTSEPRTNALVYSNGEVLWVPPIQEEVLCDPADSMGAGMWGRYNCTMKYGSWTYDGNILDLKFYNDKNYIDMDDFKEGNFKVLHNEAMREVKHYSCCPDPYPALIFSMTIQRTKILTEQGMGLNPMMV